MKAFDVAGSTVYEFLDINNNDDVRIASKDCYSVVLPSILMGHYGNIGQCCVSDDTIIHRATIDWLITILAEDKNEVKRIVSSSAEASKQHSYIYDIADIKDEVDLNRLRLY